MSKKRDVEEKEREIEKKLMHALYYMSLSIVPSCSSPHLILLWCRARKLAVVGADYRTRYPRLYALADERRRRFEIQLSRHGVEKEAAGRHFLASR